MRRLRARSIPFALKLGLKPGMKVLDVGCGVGGPMRSIARFSGATIEGVNNNDYQLTKVQQYNEEAGLAGRCSAFKGDFMNLQVPDETYDAAYAFEATCHAPDKVGVFKEIHRALKPGGMFAAYEWCMTSKFDPSSAEHQRTKKGIEEGDSLPDIASIPETLDAVRAAGFELLESHDAAGTCDPATPWYLPLVGETESLLALRRGRAGTVHGTPHDSNPRSVADRTEGFDRGKQDARLGSGGSHRRRRARDLHAQLLLLGTTTGAMMNGARWAPLQALSGRRGPKDLNPWVESAREATLSAALSRGMVRCRSIDRHSRPPDVRAVRREPMGRISRCFGDRSRGRRLLPSPRSQLGGRQGAR